MNNNDFTKDVFLKLYKIYSNYPKVDPITYEIIFWGTREQLRAAIKLLETSGIDYMADWRNNKDPTKTYVLILKAETIILKSQ